MRKRLLLVALLIVSQLSYITAQDLFSVPDTVCIRQPVFIHDSVSNAQSYYWGFCSGFTLNNPIGNNFGPQPEFVTPGAIDVAKDGNNYYGFVANVGNNEMIRLDFGTSLSNIPTYTSLGTLNNTMPDGPSKIYIYKDGSNGWFVFVSGGSTVANSSLMRLDFGSSLGNTPNTVNFGNLNNDFNAPRGFFIVKEGTSYYGYVVNAVDNSLVKLDFGGNISNTPITTNQGAGFGLNNPSDMVAVQDNGDWYAFVTNQTSNEIIRLDFGASLVNIPSSTNNGNIDNKIFGPTGITFVRDCDFIHLLITNGISNDVMRIDMPTIMGPYTGKNFTAVGSLALPTSISRIIREVDDIYCFVTNAGGNSVSNIIFNQCSSASISSSTNQTPPVYAYSTPGTYNVYFVVNEGLPNMQVQCKQIVALPIPQITFHNDTLICQGDTIDIFVQAFGALSYTWYPDTNFIHMDTIGLHVQVYPIYDVDYHVVLPYLNGCIVDIPVSVTVSKNKADAGPDRTLSDGAKTMLGGPMTTYGPQYTYTWFPDQFINNTIITNPIASPPYDFTYYLEVRNTDGCYDIDTVVVKVTCDDLNLPNAFSPESKHTASNRFGLLNKQIVKLNYFRVFDRWGKMVFSTSDITKQWDGKVNGEPAPFAVYVWEADGFCVAGQRFKRSGNVTLVR